MLVAITLVPAVLGFAGDARCARAAAGAAGSADATPRDGAATALGARWSPRHPSSRVARRCCWPCSPSRSRRRAFSSACTTTPVQAAGSGDQAQATSCSPRASAPASTARSSSSFDAATDAAAQAAAVGASRRRSRQLPDVAVVGRRRARTPTAPPPLLTSSSRVRPDRPQATEQLVHADPRRPLAGPRGGTGTRSVTGADRRRASTSPRAWTTRCRSTSLIVVGLALVLLVLVFRSLLVPLVGVLGFLLTIGASLGATVAVFQWGWLADVVNLDATGPLISLTPILVIGILFGLAMDYQVFLVSRMHEAHAHGAAPLDAVRTGFRARRPVVVAAALIMFSVFAGFVLGRRGARSSPIAFALAIGILFDAFVVRMVLVPAALALLGEPAWWLPRWLDRIIPNVDIEGAALDERTGSHTAAAPVDEVPRGARPRAPTPRTGCTPPSDVTRAGVPRRTPALARHAGSDSRRRRPSRRSW